jgi:chromosome segregation ATPase
MTEEEKEHLKQEINSGIDKLNARLETLKGREAELEGKLRKELQNRIADLEEKRRELLSRSSQLGYTAGEAARNLGDGVRSAFKELERGVNSAWNEFKK